MAMKAIMKMKAENKARLSAHPFYTWVESDEVPLEQRLTFAPIMAPFVMNFRDMNKWFIRYTEPKNEFERIINGNTLEDETHSRLFLEDWRKIQLDRTLGWSAGDTIWWLFLAPDTEPFRRYGMDFARFTVADGGDPMLRFAHSEAGEACGNAFFRVLARVASKIQAKTGTEYRYFGPHHLGLEPGHVLESEGVFELKQLDDERRQKGLTLAKEMFEIIFGMHDCFLDYARTYVAHGTTPRRRKGPPLPLSTVPPEPTSRGKATETISPMQNEVQRALDARRAQTAAHPFYAWLRENNGVSPTHKLQRFVPMWVMDIMGYRDLNRYVLRFADEDADAKRAYNRWVDSLESHSALFLNDWDALEMDEALSWKASETLEFLFLDPYTDVHRRNIASFIKLAYAHTKPLLRFWLLEALEASGEAFFENTRALTSTFETYTGRRLDYLSDRHYVAHPADAPSASGRPHYPFKSEPMTSEQRDVALEMVKTVFDAVDEQLLISFEVAETNRFEISNRVLSVGRSGSRPPTFAPRVAIAK
jgi:hypothetical protein